MGQEEGNESVDEYSCEEFLKSLSLILLLVLIVACIVNHVHLSFMMASANA